MKSCPRCGTHNDDARAHCSQCGQDLEAQVCPNGHPLPGGIPPDSCPWCPSTTAGPHRGAAPAGPPSGAGRRATEDLSSTRGGGWGAPAANGWDAPPASGGHRATMHIDEYEGGAATPQASGPPSWDGPAAGECGADDGAEGLAKPAARRGGTIVMGGAGMDPQPSGGGTHGSGPVQPSPPGGRRGTVVMGGGIGGHAAQPGDGGQQPPRAAPGLSGGRLVGVLYSFTGDTDGSVWPVRYGRSLIGSAGEVAVRLAFNGVSRNHCQILSRPTPGGQGSVVRIMDLGPVNGTIVNGLDIQGQHTLEHGDKVRVGPIELVYMAVPPPGI